MMKDDAPKPPLVNQTKDSLLLVAQTMSEASPVTQDEASRTSPEISELLKGNTTLFVWLVFLAFGGGILALYYARIGYLPDIEWSSSLVYLAVASFIGGGVGLLYALSLLLPGFIWAEYLLYDRHLVRVFRLDRRGGEPCIRTVLRYLGFPFFVVLLVSHICLKADECPLLAKLAVSVGSPITYLTLAVALLFLTFFVMKSLFKLLLRLKYSALFGRSRVTPAPTTSPALSDDLDKGQSVSPNRRKRRSRETIRRHLFKYAIWFTLSVFLSQISMLLLYRLSGTLPWRSFGVLTVICTFGVFISNHVVAVRYRHHPRQAVGASLVAALVLLFVADRFSSLSMGIMDFYGFGKNHKANLLVTDDGFAIIEKLGLPLEYRTLNREGLRDVEILSKVGSEYYLRIGHSDVDPGRTFTLPKSAVKSLISTER